MDKLYYLASYLWRRKVPFLPRLIMLIIRVVFGSFIPFKATIGKGVSFGHKIGIVISPNAIIGNNVKIRHGVTIGSGTAKIGSNVEFGAGAKVIGSVTIGDGVKIGANAVVIEDIPYMLSKDL